MLLADSERCQSLNADTASTTLRLYPGLYARNPPHLHNVQLHRWAEACM